MGLIKLVVFDEEYEGLQVVRTKDIKLPYDEVHENFMGFFGENILMDVEGLLNDIDKFREYVVNLKAIYKNKWAIGEGSHRWVCGVKKS